MVRCLCALLMGCLSACPALAQGVRQESGSLQQLVKELTSRDYLLRSRTSDSRPFVQPDEELRFARRAALNLAVGEIEKAAEDAARFDYEVVEFQDVDTQRRFYVMREDLGRVPTARGWGAYLLNPQPEFEALVEAPHPLGDSNSAPLAAGVFSGGARGLLIAGAHREKADLPDFVESIFHQVHAAWTSGKKLLPVLQVHGFAAHKHRFPKDAQMILSTGGGQVVEELKQLDHQFDKNGFPSYVYNTLDPSSDANRTVNGKAPGAMFRSLAATKNEQGRHLRGLGGTFLHLEFETNIRHNAELRDRAAEIVAKTMTRIAPADRPPKKIRRKASKVTASG